MKRLRLLGLMLMALFALGVTVAATASASERGFLTLKEETSVKLSQEKEEPLTNKATLKTALGTITCEKLQVLPVTFTEPGKTHFNLAKDVHIEFFGCLSEALGGKCTTPGLGAGEILVLVDLHLVNALSGTKLIPAAFLLVLNNKLENVPIIIECNKVKVEVKGATAALVTVASLTSEVTAAGIRAVPSITCDKENEKVCEEIQKNEPFMSNLGLGFEKATEESEKETPLKSSVDVLWDD